MYRNNVDYVVKELLEELSQENVKITATDGGVWQYSTKMDTKIEGRNNTLVSNSIVLNIPDYNLFVRKIGKYLDVASKFYEKDKEYFMLDGNEYLKRLVLDLFLNATNYDLYNIYNYIDFKKDMLSTEYKDKTFELGTLKVGNETLTIFGSIKRQKFNMEAPYAFEVCLSNGIENFVLPSILFGTTSDTAVVYAIQNLHREQETQLKKRLDRYFRKIDNGIVEKGTNKIPYDERPLEEQVTINAVVAAAIFVETVKRFDVLKFIVPDFMPLRYSTKLNQNVFNVKQKSNAEYVDELTHKAIDDMNRNQFNITNKLIYTFLRLGMHFDNLDVNYSPDENRLYVDSICEEYSKDGNLIQDIVEAISNKQEQK